MHNITQEEIVYFLQEHYVRLKNIEATPDFAYDVTSSKYRALQALEGVATEVIKNNIKNLYAKVNSFCHKKESELSYHKQFYVMFERYVQHIVENTELSIEQKREWLERFPNEATIDNNCLGGIMSTFESVFVALNSPNPLKKLIFTAHNDVLTQETSKLFADEEFKRIIDDYIGFDIHIPGVLNYSLGIVSNDEHVQNIYLHLTTSDAELLSKYNVWYIKNCIDKFKERYFSSFEAQLKRLIEEEARCIIKTLKSFNPAKTDEKSVKQAKEAKDILFEHYNINNDTVNSLTKLDEESCMPVGWDEKKISEMFKARYLILKKVDKSQAVLLTLFLVVAISVFFLLAFGAIAALLKIRHHPTFTNGTRIALALVVGFSAAILLIPIIFIIMILTVILIETVKNDGFKGILDDSFLKSLESPEPLSKKDRQVNMADATNLLIKAQKNIVKMQKIVDYSLANRTIEQVDGVDLPTNVQERIAVIKTKIDEFLLTIESKPIGTLGLLERQKYLLAELCQMSRDAVLLTMITNRQEISTATQQASIASVDGVSVQEGLGTHNV